MKYEENFSAWSSNSERWRKLIRANLSTISFKSILVLLFVSLISSANIIAQELDLDEEFSELETCISEMEELDTTVSKAPVKWHLLHALQVINGVYEQANGSSPADYSSKTNVKWRYVSVFGKIPRGKVKAPNAVNPSFDIDENEIRTELEKAKKSLSKWSSLEENNFYTHAVLLDLNKRKLKKFLTIHTQHHLKIVSDILKSNQANLVQASK